MKFIKYQHDKQTSYIILSHCRCSFIYIISHLSMIRAFIQFNLVLDNDVVHCKCDITGFLISDTGIYVILNLSHYIVVFIVMEFRFVSGGYFFFHFEIGTIVHRFQMPACDICCVYSHVIHIYKIRLCYDMFLSTPPTVICQVSIWTPIRLINRALNLRYHIFYRFVSSAVYMFCMAIKCFCIENIDYDWNSNLIKWENQAYFSSLYHCFWCSDCVARPSAVVILSDKLVHLFCEEVWMRLHAPSQCCENIGHFPFIDMKYRNQHLIYSMYR